MPDREGWALEGFASCLDRWIEREEPADDLRLLVAAWVFTRADDPYVGVRREPEFDNLWFGPVPGSVHDAHRVVVGSYWVLAAERRLRCDSIATLNLPL